MISSNLWYNTANDIINNLRLLYSTYNNELTYTILLDYLVQKFGFIKLVDKCWIITVKDLES